MEENYEPERKSRREKTDWRPVYVSLFVQLLTVAYMLGGLGTRVTNIENKEAVVDSRGGFATHDDLKDLAVAQTIQDQNRDLRISSLDDELKAILSGNGTSQYRPRVSSLGDGHGTIRSSLQCAVVPDRMFRMRGWNTALSQDPEQPCGVHAGDGTRTDVALRLWRQDPSRSAPGAHMARGDNPGA